MHRLRSALVILLAGSAFAIGGRALALAQNRAPDFKTEFASSLAPLPDSGSLSVRASIYVPAYSVREAKDAPGLATLLRVDNTSAGKPLVIERIDYYGTDGHLVQRYVDAPLAIKPFGAIQIFIPADDRRGGPAANFIVTWAGSGPIAEPLIETVMFGMIGGANYSFVSRGRSIKTVGRKQWFSLGPVR